MTAFGVFWGIFMLIIMLGAGNGLYNGAMNDFSRLASNSVFIWTQPTNIPYKGFPRGRRFYFNNDDIEILRAKIPEIEHIAPRNQLGGHRGVAMDQAFEAIKASSNPPNTQIVIRFRKMTAGP